MEKWVLFDLYRLNRWGVLSVSLNVFYLKPKTFPFIAQSLSVPELRYWRNEIQWVNWGGWDTGKTCNFYSPVGCWSLKSGPWLLPQVISREHLSTNTTITHDQAMLNLWGKFYFIKLGTFSPGKAYTEELGCFLKLLGEFCVRQFACLSTTHAYNLVFKNKLVLHLLP